MKTLLFVVIIIIVGMATGEVLLRACLHPFPHNQSPAYCDK